MANITRIRANSDEHLSNLNLNILVTDMPRRDPPSDGTPSNRSSREHSSRAPDADQSAGETASQASPDGQTCPQCWRNLGPLTEQCPYCKADVSSADFPADKIPTGNTTTWTFDRIIFVAVPAPSSPVALAKAKGVFRQRDGFEGSIRDHELKSFRLVDEFDKVPVTKMADDWDQVPAYTPATDPEGQTVLDRFADTPWTHISLDGGRRPPLYDEHGTAILSSEDFEAFRDTVTGESDYYLVSALAYIPETHSERDGDIREFECRECGSVQPHDCDGTVGVPPALRDYNRNGDPVANARNTPKSTVPDRVIGPFVWRCLECRTPRTGPKCESVLESPDPEPADVDAPPESETETSTPSLTAEMLPKPARGPDAEHEYYMEQLQERGVLPSPQSATQTPAQDTHDE
ncbi:hypothetical protein SAMN05216388_102611 [Halorientalis persicus]|uniref:Uncharacterized protein n=2 Tax=Halorientalis persicus TaxID=1367881 RepID=A0A1H8U8L2_9EURY|nr:hypothetical protein SAMN05216388_102611 [Halorientalis persicus]